MMLYQNLVNKKPTTRLIEWEFFIVIIFVIFKKAIIRIAGVNIFLKNRNYSGAITEIFKTFPKFSKSYQSVLYRVFILLQMQTQ